MGFSELLPRDLCLLSNLYSKAVLIFTFVCEACLWKETLRLQYLILLVKEMNWEDMFSELSWCLLFVRGFLVSEMIKLLWNIPFWLIDDDECLQLLRLKAFCQQDSGLSIVEYSTSSGMRQVCIFSWPPNNHMIKNLSWCDKLLTNHETYLNFVKHIRIVIGVQRVSAI